MYYLHHTSTSLSPNTPYTLPTTLSLQIRDTVELWRLIPPNLHYPLHLFNTPYHSLSLTYKQIRDTVELWRLPNQRKISLRFLAAYLLKADIQDEIHDSIEDAKTALLLYLHYELVRAKGELHR